MTFPIARLALLILFLLLGAPPARAQEPVEFDPVRDLEQFEQHSFSEYSELYDVGGFEARKGEVVSPEELAALRASWKEKVERATARIAAIRSDPREKTWYALRKELARTYSRSIGCCSSSGPPATTPAGPGRSPPTTCPG
jgi:hypothetical protein